MYKSIGVDNNFFPSYWENELPIYNKEKIDEIKEKHYDATHNVFAYILKDKFSQRGIDDIEEKEITEFYNYIVDKYIENLKGIEKVKELSVKNYIRKV